MDVGLWGCTVMVYKRAYDVCIDISYTHMCIYVRTQIYVNLIRRSMYMRMSLRNLYIVSIRA